MNRIKWSFTILATCFIVNATFAQIKFEGQVLDAMNSSPIEDANVRIVGTNAGTATDKNGAFSLSFESLPSKILISYVGYQTEEILLDSVSIFQDVFYLLPKSNKLTEITIRSEVQVESLSNVEESSVVAFEIQDDKIFRLEYFNAFEKYKLIMTDLSGEVEASIRLKDIKKISGLYKSCTARLYVLSRDSAYAVEYTQSKLSLGLAISMVPFKAYVMPCSMMYDNKMYYINQRNNGLTKVVSCYDDENDKLSVLKTIEDAQQVQSYRESFGIIAQSQTIDNIQVSSVCENERIRNIQENGDFLQTVFYQPEYPVFIARKKEMVVLLNHIEKSFDYYVEDQLQSTKEISYFLDKKWLQEILIDPLSQKVYGLFDLKSGIGVKEIDLSTGLAKLVAIVETPLHNYETIKINNGSIYYLKENTSEGLSNELLRYAM